MRFAPTDLGELCKLGAAGRYCAKEAEVFCGRKWLRLLTLFCVLGVVVEIRAEEYVWTGGRWNPSWCNPLNWGRMLGDPNGVPGADDTALINSPPYRGAVIDCNVHVSNIEGPRYNSDTDQVMDVVQGDVVIDGEWQAGIGGSGTGAISISGNAHIHIAGRWRVADQGPVTIDISGAPNIMVGTYFQGGDQTDGRLAFTMSGGSLYVNDLALLGDDGSGSFDISGGTFSCERFRLQVREEEATAELNVSGTAEIVCRGGNMSICEGAGTASLNISGGTVAVAADLTLAGDDDGTGIINTTAGSVSIGGTFVVPGDSEGTGIVNLQGGTVRCGAFAHNGDNWSMDIRNGILIIDGDVTDYVQADVEAGRITAFGEVGCSGTGVCSRGKVLIDFNNVNPGKTTISAQAAFETSWCPSPVNGTTGVASQGTVLCWCPGDSADVHYVYLSTDYNAVADGSAYVAILGGHDNTCYDSGPLLLGQTYYWAVHEQYFTTVTPGQVLQFRVEDRRVMDDMEAYNKRDNYIFDTWRDGCGDMFGMNGNGTGSCVDLTIFPAHSGAKSMRYVYENNCCIICCWNVEVCYSEATRTFGPPQNWSASDEKALTLWFCGDRWNESTKMWVVLNGNLDAMAAYGDYGDDPEDIRKEEWIDWNIKLADFADGGVDLSNVESITIGFGDRIGGEPSGMGIVHFDDITLYPTRCVPKYAREIIDLNADCIVDMKDIALMAYWWLEDRR